MATIYQVSQLAGVSLATVSRVVNNNKNVSEKTRDKVKQAMAQLDYRPNAIAQSLASNCSNSIGVLVSELSGPFFGEMMAGIEEELRNAGKHVIITPGHSEEDKEKDGIEFLLSRHCDALILHAEAVNDDYLIALSKKKTPIILISRMVESLSSHCISLDNELGGYLATQALVAKGHVDIAYIAGALTKSDAKDRLAGHKRALKENNIAFNPCLYFQGDFKQTGGKNGLKHFIDSKQPFSAVVCANDEMASGAMKYAREHGFNLPNDLSIIGFDNGIFADYLFPPLTTINNPIFAMGQMAARLVLKNVYGKEKPLIQHFFKPELILRDSITER